MNPIATTPSALRERATRYRALVHLISDNRTMAALLVLAVEYEALADKLERAEQDNSPEQSGK